MAYKLKCNQCGNTFHSVYRTAQCPKNHSGYTTTEFLGDVLETAADVATAYFMVDVASDVLDGVGSLIGGLFD